MCNGKRRVIFIKYLTKKYPGSVAGVVVAGLGDVQDASQAPRGGMRARRHCARADKAGVQAWPGDTGTPIDVPVPTSCKHPALYQGSQPGRFDSGQVLALDCGQGS